MPLRQRKVPLSQLHERLRALAVEGRHPGVPVLGADIAAKQTELAMSGHSGLYALRELEDVWDALIADDYVDIVTALTHYTLTFEREAGFRK